MLREREDVKDEKVRERGEEGARERGRERERKGEGEEGRGRGRERERKGEGEEGRGRGRERGRGWYERRQGNRRVRKGTGEKEGMRGDRGRGRYEEEAWEGIGKEESRVSRLDIISHLVQHQHYWHFSPSPPLSQVKYGPTSYKTTQGTSSPSPCQRQKDTMKRLHATNMDQKFQGVY
jgi:hypothetical protein